MKPDNIDLIKALLEHSASMQEDIFDDTEEMLGTVPFILQIMARRPEFMIFSSLKDFYALRPRSLDPKTAELSTRGRERGRDPGCRFHCRHYRPDQDPGLGSANFPGV
jgi:hypothetical protein